MVDVAEASAVGPLRVRRRHHAGHLAVADQWRSVHALPITTEPWDCSRGHAVDRSTVRRYYIYLDIVF